MIFTRVLRISWAVISRSLAGPKMLPAMSGWWMRKRVFGSDRRSFLSAPRRMTVAMEAVSPIQTMWMGLFTKRMAS